MAPEDSDRVRGQKFMLVAMTVGMSLGGIMWGGLLLAFGLAQQSIIPFGYVVLSVINLAMLHMTKKFQVSGHIQVALSMLLPFGLQFWMGGFLASGVVMLWSPVAILGALVLQRGKGMGVWVIMFLSLTVLSGIFNNVAESIKPEIITDSVSVLFSSIPVLSTIHSLLVSIIFSRSAFLTTFSGV